MKVLTAVGARPQFIKAAPVSEALRVPEPEQYRPDFVLVHGDPNSTLAAALAAVKLQVKVAHNEAGLRSFNRSMPEEPRRW